MSHVERMKVEHKELKAKVDALNEFIYSNKIFHTLEDIERIEMIKQCGHMESYLSLLERRIWRAVEYRF